jgi:hypothetical protein
VSSRSRMSCGNGLPGTIPINAAANNPVDSSAISQVNLSPTHQPTHTIDTPHGSQISRNRRQPRKRGRKHDTDIPNINGKVQPVQDVVDDARGNHQAGVDGPSDDSAEWVPCGRVEPVPEFLYEQG